VTANRSPRRQRVTRSRSRMARNGSTSGRRIGGIEGLFLFTICAAFIAVFSYSFSQRSAISPAPLSFLPAEDRGIGESNTTGMHIPHTAEGTRKPIDYIPSEMGSGTIFDCPAPRVVDGDTLHCGPIRVRLASIDAPELPGHCRRGRVCTPGDPFASAEHLQALIAARPLSCRQKDIDRYGRIVAYCAVAGQDLSCAQVQSGNAVIRYGSLSCGKS
jgi:endonuclease YncB( thermonuclease family)